MTDHDRIGKEVVDSILKKFKDGEWECNGDLGRDFYRTGTPKTHPSPDHAFANDNPKIMVTFEYKPADTETKRGILTGLGQSIAYLNKSDISFLVIPKKLTGKEDNFDIESQMTEIFEKQIVGNLPTGLIVYDNNDPKDVTMVHNVDSLLGREIIQQKYTGRFWANYVDLPIPLFHLVLHYYYLAKLSKKKNQDPLANCWKKSMVLSKSVKKLQPNAIKDVHGDIIRTLDDSKDKMYFDKTFAKIRRLSGQEKKNAIEKMKEDYRTDIKKTNMYQRVMKKNIKPFLEGLGVVGDGELTALGVKLYHLGLTNGPNSIIFRDYFLKCVLEQGRHLDLIFDLERLCKEHRDEKTTLEIRKTLEEEYDEKGMIKRNPNLVVGTSSNTEFLKDEFILWGKGFGIKEKINGKPDLSFNWEKITRVRALPEL